MLSFWHMVRVLPRTELAGLKLCRKISLAIQANTKTLFNLSVFCL